MSRQQVIQQLISEGRFEEAFSRSSSELEQSPDDPEYLYLAAVSARYLGRFDDAAARLERLKTLSPDNGRAHQEEGHNFRDRGQDEAALAAYARACHYNPALLASWKGQAEILKALGRRQQWEFVTAELNRLESLPSLLVAVMDLVSQGKLIKAEDYCRQFLLKVPHHAEAMRLLADIGVRLGVLDDAEFLLESAVEFEPDNPRVRRDYVNVLRKKQKYADAVEQARLLLAMDPANLQYQSIYAIESMQAGDFDGALERFNNILKQVPEDPYTLTSAGHALKSVGRSDQAIDNYHAALVRYPGHGEAYYSLANLKTYRFTSKQVADMRLQLDRADLSFMDRVYLCFALAKALEDESDFESSFHYYSEGNRMKKAQSRYSADQMHDEFQAQKRVCTAELFSEKRGCLSADPIFIVGLPRAGSTLLEQILASHSQVDGTLELPNIVALSHRLRRGEKISSTSDYPDALVRLTADEARQLGEDYIRDTRIHRQNAPFFIDKMPNNFRHIGLIKLILPNARIIDARRDPMSCCFSGFKQLFAEGQEFSYSLQDIGRYYRDYVDLMDHWHKVLPGEILTVQHEEVVDDLEGQVKRILKFCELPFEQACVNYHETDRVIRTPSSEQVRQPIFRDALDQWRKYDPYLAPLKQALKQNVE